MICDMIYTINTKYAIALWAVPHELSWYPWDDTQYGGSAISSNITHDQLSSVVAYAIQIYSFIILEKQYLLSKYTSYSGFSVWMKDSKFKN